jgi:hypothetical protein
MAFAFSDPSYEPPYFKNPPTSAEPYLPDLPHRVALCAGQGINYYKRYQLNRHRMTLYFRIFSKSSHVFDERYRKKVTGEYQWYEFTRKQQTPISSTKRKPANAPANVGPINRSCMTDTMMSSVTEFMALFDEVDS